MFILTEADLKNPQLTAVLRNQCEKIGADVWRSNAAAIMNRAEYQITAKAFQQMPYTETGFQSFDVLQLEDLTYYSSDFSPDYRAVGASTWFYGQTLDLKPLFNKSIAQRIDCSSWKTQVVENLQNRKPRCVRPVAALLKHHKPAFGHADVYALPLRASTVTVWPICAASGEYRHVSFSPALCRELSIVTHAEWALSGSVLMAQTSSSSTKMRDHGTLSEAGRRPSWANQNLCRRRKSPAETAARAAAPALFLEAQESWSTRGSPDAAR